MEWLREYVRNWHLETEIARAQYQQKLKLEADKEWEPREKQLPPFSELEARWVQDLPITPEEGDANPDPLVGESSTDAGADVKLPADQSSSNMLQKRRSQVNELQISRAEGNKPFWAVNNTVDEPYTEEDVEDSWMLHPLQRVVKREGIALRDALAGTRLLNMSISGLSEICYDTSGRFPLTERNLAARTLIWVAKRDKMRRLGVISRKQLQSLEATSSFFGLKSGRLIDDKELLKAPKSR